MIGTITCLVFCLGITVKSEYIDYENVTLMFQPADRQLFDFAHEHPEIIGLWAMSSGEPTEIRQTRTINSEQITNQEFIEEQLHGDGEKIPERIVHSKGGGAFGYFVVTHDVSKYTYADVFNGIGKKTPLVVRFSTGLQDHGGNDLAREFKGMTVKMYTKQGNLDFACLSTPVYVYRDPIQFTRFVHAFKRNPRTHLYDFTMRWDLLTLEPVGIHNFFWLLSDYGIPKGYRRMDAFPIHTFELANKKGETHYVRFNFRTEQGFAFFTSEEAAAIAGVDPDYYNRDLYNNIESKNYPSWRLEMDVMSKHDLLKVDYDPFDVTRLWKNGTFHTVQIGRMVLNKNVENQFRDVEQGAYNPAHLVPGIPGPVDYLFKGRRLAYRDTQNHRLGRNHNKILVNMPLYAKTYNRDGTPPTRLNVKDAPNYYPNSFHGQVPYVDERKPREKLLTLESNAVDLGVPSYFYNHILKDDAQRLRFIENVVMSLVPVTPPVDHRVLKILYLIDHDLGTKVQAGLEVARAAYTASNAATEAPVTIPVTVPSAQDKKHSAHSHSNEDKESKKDSDSDVTTANS